jgi:hypothetical protein
MGADDERRSFDRDASHGLERDFEVKVPSKHEFVGLEQCRAS